MGEKRKENEVKKPSVFDKYLILGPIKVSESSNNANNKLSGLPLPPPTPPGPAFIGGGFWGFFWE